MSSARSLVFCQNGSSDWHDITWLVNIGNLKITWYNWYNYDITMTLWYNAHHFKTCCCAASPGGSEEGWMERLLGQVTCHSFDTLGMMIRHDYTILHHTLLYTSIYIYIPYTICYIHLYTSICHIPYTIYIYIHLYTTYNILYILYTSIYIYIPYTIYYITTHYILYTTLDTIHCTLYTTH